MGLSIGKGNLPTSRRTLGNTRAMSVKDRMGEEMIHTKSSPWILKLSRFSIVIQDKTPARTNVLKLIKVSH